MPGIFEAPVYLNQIVNIKLVEIAPDWWMMQINELEYTKTSKIQNFEKFKNRRFEKKILFIEKIFEKS